MPGRDVYLSGCDSNMLEKLLSDKIVFAVLITLCLLGNGSTKLYIIYHKHTHNVGENEETHWFNCSWSIKYATIGAMFTLLILNSFIYTIWAIMNGQGAKKNNQNSSHFDIPGLYIWMTIPIYLVLIMFLVKEKELTFPLMFNNFSWLLSSVHVQPPNHQRDRGKGRRSSRLGGNPQGWGVILKVWG